MPLIDITSESVGQVLDHRFAAAADQSRFRSSFAVVDGKVPAGFKTVAEMREDQYHPHISAKTSGWVPLEEAQGKDFKNTFKHNGTTYTEVVAPASDFAEKYEREGRLSRQNAEGIMNEGIAAARSTGDTTPVEATSLIPRDVVESQSSMEDQLKDFGKKLSAK